MEIKNSLQYRICKSLVSEVKELTRYKFEDVCYMIFKNLQLTEKSISGLRLTPLGYKLLNKRYETYKFPLPEAGIKKILLIQLHKNMKWPYFIDKKNLYLFSGDDAMWMKLSGSDIEKFAKDLE